MVDQTQGTALDDRTEVLRRQVIRQRQDDDGLPMRVAFRPTPKDRNKLSSDREEVSLQDSHRRYGDRTGRRDHTTWGVSVGEAHAAAEQAGFDSNWALAAVDDGGLDGNPTGHASVIFPEPQSFSKTQIPRRHEALGRELHRSAVERGRFFVMSGLIVHEWLEPRGGAERVVDAMREAFPDADLLALRNDAPEKYPDAQETWLAGRPLRRHKAAALPALPWAWRNVRPYARQKRHDWILVSSHLFAHHVRPRGTDRDIPKFVYAHTPARYIWTPELDQRGDSAVVKAASALLKPLDRRRAQEPVKIAANSKFVRDRIREAWDREAEVIYPPVDVERIQSVAHWRTQLSGDDLRTSEGLPSEFILGASRFVPYKRLDWVIRAVAANDVLVVIAGSGPEEERLRALAAEVSVPVHFVLRPSTELLYALYQAARVFVFPAIEDFGIMPVEAQAAGTPVVVTSVGGATESVQDGVTGEVSAEGSRDALEAAVARALGRGGDIRGSVAPFDKRSHVTRLRKWVAAMTQSQAVDA